jgi:hypothetical protein
MLNNGQVVDRRVVRLETVRELLFILTRRDHGRRSFCQQRFVSSKTGSWRHGTSMRPPLNERIGLGHDLVAALPFESGRSLTVHSAKSSRAFPSPSRFSFVFVLAPVAFVRAVFGTVLVALLLLLQVVVFVVRAFFAGRWRRDQRRSGNGRRIRPCRHG